MEKEEEEGQKKIENVSQAGVGKCKRRLGD